ncbi:MAG: hypothetical protein SFU98_12640 [Leptospiraceae bacterium]|nr:hypothetical protein [Leptospiraceae bacterium]
MEADFFLAADFFFAAAFFLATIDSLLLDLNRSLLGEEIRFTFVT